MSVFYRQKNKLKKLLTSGEEYDKLIELLKTTKTHRKRKIKNLKKVVDKDLKM